MMGHRRVELRPLAALVKVVFVLLVIDSWVAGPFFDRYSWERSLPTVVIYTATRRRGRRRMWML